MRLGLKAGLVLATALAWLTGLPAAETPDYSQESFVVQNMATTVSFSGSGAREWHQTLSVRIQSEAAVRQFGVLAFSYEAENEAIKIDYVRVKKPDGTVTATPESSFLDVASEAATAAPTYSDLRQKQIPVKALGVGDVLEYAFRSTQKAPEVPGQFWYAQYFADDAVILGQSLEVSFPKDKYVQVSSAKLKPEIRDEGDRRVYWWKHSHLEPSKPKEKKQDSGESEPLKVQLTTFRNWEEVGNWWASLARPQAVISPAIQSKAKELTANLTSEDDKARAIYEYVALKFRYISISLGAGRYRPHSAAEVFANQYGDCKDKHILFAALLKAAGIQAWPALIGAGIKFDAGLPSPVQFNHVVTVLPRGERYVWADTTAEVAPFGLLNLAIRDQQALVIPDSGKAILVKTPLTPPMLTSGAVDLKSSLSADGTLTGRFHLEMTGDAAVAMRTGFRQLAPAQWPALAQQLVYSLGFSGEASGVELENLEAPEKPLQYSYDYTRKNFSDWQEHRITAPLPPLGFGPGDEAEKPKEPFWAGEPGAVHYHASVRLPKGYTIELPPDTKLSSDFAEYSSHYALLDGALSVDRKMIIKKAKIEGKEWADYQKFSKESRDDQARYMLLSQSNGVQTPAAASESNQEAERLMEQVPAALQAQNLNEVNDLLAQIERLNPKQMRLWVMRGYLAASSGHTEEAVADCRKEIQFYPDEIPAYQTLAAILLQAGRRQEAIDAWRDALRVKPEDEIAVKQMVGLLRQAKQYQEVVTVLAKPISAAPDNYHLQAWRVDALLHSGQTEQGIAEAQKVAGSTTDATILNDLAYSLSDTGCALGKAEEWAQKVVRQSEQGVATAQLNRFEEKDLAAVTALASEWDTLGWTYFKQHRFAEAEKFLQAGWQLAQHADIADHLGQLYNQQGKQAAAIHHWRLALAANSGNEDAREQLRKAGVPILEPAVGRAAPVGAAEELGILRTVKVAALPKQTGSAEFFLLLSRKGIEEVKFISGADGLKNSERQIMESGYRFPFPDAGPEKLIRRGILACSTYTNPSCQLTMLLPSTTTAAQASENQTHSGQSASGVQPPTLRQKVEPDYSEDARHARLEGTVRLSIVVDEEGVPKDISVTKPLGLGLDEKAKECVAKWRFNPATKSGKAVSAPATVEINFRMIKDAQ